MVTDEYPPDHGGVGRSVERIAGELSGDKLEITVAVTGPDSGGDKVAVTQDGDVTVVRFPRPRTINGGRKERDTLRLLRLMRYFDDRDIALVHSFFPTTTGMYAGIMAKRRCRPFVASFRGNDIYQGIFSRHLQTIRWILSHADMVTFMNREMADLALAVAPHCKAWQVVKNGVQETFETAKLRRDGKPPVIGISGVLRTKKGIETLIDACRVLKSSRAFELLLVGDFTPSERDHFEGRIESAGLQHLTRKVGLVRPSGVLGHLLEMDIFVSPALYDGCPNSLLEAAAAGLPIVCSRVAAHREILEEDTECLMHEPEDAAGLAGCLAALLESRSRRERLARAARKRVLDQFSVQKEKARWHGIYEALLKKGRPGHV
jgi:glycosyltransferase involved in cell wall biosynthesis